jgi:hypothetical protein
MPLKTNIRFGKVDQGDFIAPRPKLVNPVRQTYRVYGLTLESDVPVTGLSPLPEAMSCPDVQLHFAAVPSWVTQTLLLPITSIRVRPSSFFPGDGKFTVYEFADRRFFQLMYSDGTRFLMDHAATLIWGEPGPGLSYDDLFVYLLGPVLGFALRQRGTVTLHASSLSIQGNAIALVGEADAGKSTTAAALALRGWPVLGEDVCALADSEGQYQVLPGYPRVCLWPDSVNFLFSSPDALPLMVSGWEKRFLSLDGSRARFATSSAPLAAILLLAERSAQDSAPSIEPISQREALLRLVQNTYMNWYLDRRQRAEEFDVLTRLVASTDCFQVIPSSDPARLNTLAKLIEGYALRLFDSRPNPALGTASSHV